MPNLPCELLDHIVDLLYDGQAFGHTPLGLENCCLVSKSWIPRTRRHLFAKIRFRTVKSLESWMKTFPDPSISPACYTKLLWIGCPQAVMTEGAEAGGWIASFSNVEHLELGGHNVHARGWEVAFALFYGFSPVITSLRMKMVPLTFPRFFDLVLSFPLLEDLDMIDCSDVPIDDDGNSEVLSMSTAVQSSSLPMFTGSLNLYLKGGMGPIVRRLLALVDGVHFRKLSLSWTSEEDIPLTMALMERCSRTLEYLYISCGLPGEPRSTSFTLSKATKLRDVVFRLNSRKVEWVTLALQTVGHEHRDLQRISINAHPALTIIPSSSYPDIGQAIGEGTIRRWLDLDRLLVHLQESRSIRTRIVRPRRRSKSGTVDYIGDLLPEITKRGMIELVG